MSDSDPLPYELEGERFATNRYPYPGWGEYAFSPRHGYADHEQNPDLCDDCEAALAPVVGDNTETPLHALIVEAIERLRAASAPLGMSTEQFQARTILDTLRILTRDLPALVGDDTTETDREALARLLDDKFNYALDSRLTYEGRIALFKIAVDAITAEFTLSSRATQPETPTATAKALIEAARPALDRLGDQSFRAAVDTAGRERAQLDHALVGNALALAEADPTLMPTANGVYIPASAGTDQGPNVYVLYGGFWRMSPDIGNADEHARSAHERWGLVPLMPRPVPVPVVSDNDRA